VGSFPGTFFSDIIETASKHGVNMDRDESWDAFERGIFETVDRRERERGWELSAEIRRRADRIVSLILHSDLPRVDVEIEIRGFRAFVAGELPGKEALFDAVYLARFRRIWEQWRRGGERLLPGLDPVE
jgi:hypothetical protein